MKQKIRESSQVKYSKTIMIYRQNTIHKRKKKREFKITKFKKKYIYENFSRH